MVKGHLDGVRRRGGRKGAGRASGRAGRDGRRWKGVRTGVGRMLGREMLEIA